MNCKDDGGDPENHFNLLVVLGATASGKTQLGVALAQDVEGEILSADSRQVFRGMDIGTGKDLSEYGSVPHHLIDIVEPGSEFSVYEFQKAFYAAFETIQGRNRKALMVGGTGLYIESILKGYRLASVPVNASLRAELAKMDHSTLILRLRKARPQQHNTTDLTDRARLVRAIEISEGSEDAEDLLPPPVITSLILGIQWSRPVLHQRIISRLKERLEMGMVEEVRQLLATGIPLEKVSAYGLEYRFVCRYLKGDFDYNEFFQGLSQAIQKYAKRQETWFRRMERQGHIIHWVDGEADPLEQARQIVKGRGWV